MLSNRRSLFSLLFLCGFCLPGTLWGEPVKDAASITIYNFRIETDPASPRPGEPVTLYAVGEFPTTGYSITEKSVVMLKSYPEQYSIQLTIEKPEDVVLTVITPFREEIGTVSLTPGVHPLRVWVNGEAFYSSQIVAKDQDDPYWIALERSGGFTGWITECRIYADQTARYSYQPVREDRPLEGNIQDEMFAQLTRSLESIDFSTLQKDYQPDVNYADGYFYRILYGDYEIHVAQGAETPESLTQLMTLLENILEGKTLVPGSILTSNVELWMNY